MKIPIKKASNNKTQRELNETRDISLPCSSKSLESSNANATRPICKAPLKNGKLCPRTDKIKCPIHGKIVPRDDLGQIIDEEDRKRFEKEKLVKENAGLIEDINLALGIKIDEKNKKVSKKRKSSNLTDIRKEENTVNKRLERRLFRN